MNATTQITVPAELAEQLHKAAAEMGLDLVAYLELMNQQRLGRLDAKAVDAARFMFTRHGESLRKLAQ